ncbi:MAG: RDD family protein [Candidatus Dormibacteria bacterium]
MPSEPRYEWNANWPQLGRRVGAQRVGDAEREEVTAELAEHHVAGRLSTEELRTRCELALAARTRADLDRLTADLPRNQPGPVALSWLARPPGPFPGTRFAGFWARAGALWLDSVALVAGNAALSIPADGAHLGILLWLSPVAYFTGFWGSAGRTPGMWIAGVRVVREEDGGRLGFRRSLLRLAGYLVDMTTVGAGFLWAAVDRRRQGWHDKIAGSVVLGSR